MIRFPVILPSWKAGVRRESPEEALVNIKELKGAGMSGEDVEKVRAQMMESIQRIKGEQQRYARENEEYRKRVVRYQEMMEALKLQMTLWGEVAAAHHKVADMWKSNIGDGPVIRAKADTLMQSSMDLDQILKRFEEPKGQTS